jgi:hypothetical protein
MIPRACSMKERDNKLDQVTTFALPDWEKILEIIGQRTCTGIYNEPSKLKQLESKPF